jgi:type I restriction enzyme M protein
VCRLIGTPQKQPKFTPQNLPPFSNISKTHSQISPLFTIVLPLGVLFRGNAEGDIRKKIIQKGYIKGIIGLPPNLFFGTGIAACLIVLDKENAQSRKAIFMIDASKGFMKDGNKNRLRERDIHKIVDVFNNQFEIPKFSRSIPLSEIADPKNDYNLNIPRYIDSQEPEDLQDIEAHLLGGIPYSDIDALSEYWDVYPNLKSSLFKNSNRPKYSDLCVSSDEIKNIIFSHPEFSSFSKKMDSLFGKWRSETSDYLKSLGKNLHPKKEIFNISENLLKYYSDKKLTDKYAMYQHLMDYWAETMQDDMYEISADGWKAGNDIKRLEKVTKKGEKEIIKQIAGFEGLEGRLIPTSLIIQEYFAKEQKAIEELESKSESLIAEMDEIRDENNGEDGLLSSAVVDKGKISKGNLAKAIKELGKKTSDNADEFDMLHKYKKLMEDEADIQVKIKSAKSELEEKVMLQYPKLSIPEIKELVIDKKWMFSIESRIKTEMDNISHRLTQRIKELAERYETPLPKLASEVDELTKKVESHLKQMNFKW